MILPKVSIVITTYRESARPYFDLCIESVKNLDYPKELLDVIIVAPGSYARELARGSREHNYAVCSPGKEYGMPKGLNEGISWASSESEYFFVLNDDVVLSRASLRELVKYFSIIPDIGLLMPIGNDQQAKYVLATGCLVAGPYRIESLSQKTRVEMISAKSNLHAGLILADTLCLYAFLISRKVWEKVGQFDENLIGQDDIDYSMRTRQAGFINAIALDSLVWHAGGASNTLTDEQRAKSFEIFNKKWGL